MGLMQRRKGKAFERDVARAFRAVFPAASRTLTQQRDSGEAPDIQAPGFWVEAKNHRRVNIQAAFAQAVDEAERADSRDIPVAVTKDLRKEPLATLRLTDFLRLLLEIKGVEELAVERETSIRERDTSIRLLSQELVNQRWDIEHGRTAAPPRPLEVRVKAIDVALLAADLPTKSNPKGEVHEQRQGNPEAND